MSSISAFLKENSRPELVRMVCFDRNTMEYYERALAELAEDK